MAIRHLSRAVLIHRICAIGWAVALIPALLWWRQSVLFVIVASVYANVKSDIGAAEAADDRQLLERLDRLEQMLVAKIEDAPL